MYQDRGSVVRRRPGASEHEHESATYDQPDHKLHYESKERKSNPFGELLFFLVLLLIPAVYYILTHQHTRPLVNTRGQVLIIQYFKTLT